jgi:hypothetical protein
MKPMTAWTVIFLLVVGTVGACTVKKESVSTDNPATLKLAAEVDGGGASCGLSIQPGQVDHKLNNTSPDYCRRDRLNYFRFENVRSATFISLEDDYCDDNSSQWEFMLKTYIEPTTTGWLSIASLKAAQPGEIVTRGVILVSKMVKAGDQIDELSCVRITGSQPGKSG